MGSIATRPRNAVLSTCDSRGFISLVTHEASRSTTVAWHEFARFAPQLTFRIARLQTCTRQHVARATSSSNEVGSALVCRGQLRHDSSSVLAMLLTQSLVAAGQSCCRPDHIFGPGLAGRASLIGSINRFGFVFILSQMSTEADGGLPLPRISIRPAMTSLLSQPLQCME